MEPVIRRHRLSQMLELDSEAFDENDLRDLLDDVLRRPIADLALMGPSRTSSAADAAPGLDGEHAGATIAEVLKREATSVRTLRVVKEQMRVMRERSPGAAPKLVATAVYFLTIGVARRRPDGRGPGRITKLSHEQIDAGLRWVADQSWLPDELVALARRCLPRPSEG